MKLIDRYIYTVTRYLPETIKDDIAKELQATIEEMLPNNPSEKDIENVLKELGNPWTMANNYQPNKRYLIGPNFFDNYLSVLKIVISIVASVFVILSVISLFVDSSSKIDQIEFYLTLFTKLISNVFSGILQAIFWVTVVFVIMEHSSDNEAPESSEWKLTDLPEVPHPKATISRVETSVEIAFTVFFTFLVLFQPQLIGYYASSVDSGLQSIPLFNLEYLTSYTILIVFAASVTVLFSIWKLVAGRWNLKVVIANIIDNLVSIVVSSIILLDYHLFNDAFFEKVAQLFKVSPLNIELSVKTSAWILLVIIVVCSLIDSIVPLIKWLRSNKKAENN